MTSTSGKGKCKSILTPLDNRRERTATWGDEHPDGRWHSYTYDELAARDKASLDLFWLRDESLEDSASLPSPDILAAEILEDLKAALGQFAEIADGLGQRVAVVA